MPTKIQWTDAIKKRFRSYVRASDNCWEWIGGTFGGKYGQFRVGPKKMRAHRVAWLIAGNAIPEGMILCHKCDNVKCVRVDHLFIGTHKDNAVDRERKGRGAGNRYAKVGMLGENNPAAKLSRDQVNDIRHRIMNGEPCKILAADYSVCKSTIYTICRMESWQ